MYDSRIPTNSTEYDEEFKRVKIILEDKEQREELLATTGADAQKWLDLLQLLSEYPHVETTFRSMMLKAMLRLSRNTGLYPKCLIIQNVEKLGNRPIGGGSFGDVWKGKIGEKIVCMKVLRVYTSSEVEQVLKDSMREAIVWRQLTHENLLPFMGIYYLDSNMSDLCLISPWMERGNLLQFIKNSPELIDHGKLVLDVACGLAHLHDMKIVHSDLKGLNILITPDLRACLTDFGLSRVSDTRGLFSSQTSRSKGTTRWLSPELLRPGPGCVASRASDVYAFGCVCYEASLPRKNDWGTSLLIWQIYTGRIPFHEMTDAAVIFAVVMDKIHPTRPAGSPVLTDAVWDTMMTCWSSEPSSRPTMVDVVERVRQYFLPNLSDANDPNESPRRDRPRLMANVASRVRQYFLTSPSDTDDPGDSPRGNVATPQGGPGSHSLSSSPGRSRLLNEEQRGSNDHKTANVAPGFPARTSPTFTTCATYLPLPFKIRKQG